MWQNKGSSEIQMSASCRSPCVRGSDSLQKNAIKNNSSLCPSFWELHEGSFKHILFSLHQKKHWPISTRQTHHLVQHVSKLWLLKKKVNPPEQDWLFKVIAHLQWDFGKVGTWSYPIGALHQTQILHLIRL